MRWPGLAVVAMVGALAVGGGAAAAQAPSDGPVAGEAGCVGLQCPGQPSADAASEAGAFAPTLSIEGAKRVSAGYYRIPVPKSPGTEAVGWVAPPGTIADAPPEVQALSAVDPLVEAGTLERRTVVFLGDGHVVVAPPTLDADRAAEAARTAEAVRAAEKTGGAPIELAPAPDGAALAADEYGCIDAYWCVYVDNYWAGYLEQIHPISSIWGNLGYYLTDEVSSMRNRRDRDSWIAEHINGGGIRECYDSHSAIGGLGYAMNDEASSIYNSAGDGSC